MIRFLKSLILLMIIVGGIWALINRDKLQDSEKLMEEFDGWRTALSKSVGGFWEQLQYIRQSNDSLVADLSKSELKSPEAWKDTPALRMACFGLNHFGADSNDLEQLWLLADICRRFDLIAIQGIDGRDDRWLDMLADLMATMDEKADYFYVTDRGIKADFPTQNCILFNRRTVELDQLKWYTVDDPAGFFLRPPLVGWFRTRVNDSTRAFTFTVANLELPDDSPEHNRFKLKSLMRVVRKDGRMEDDVILMGKTGQIQTAGDSMNLPTGSLMPVFNGPTDLLRRQAIDNVLFNSLATAEFTGQGGVFDFYRHYNLTLEQAQALTYRLPVWAEFSVFEAGQQHAQSSHASH